VLYWVHQRGGDAIVFENVAKPLLKQVRFSNYNLLYILIPLVESRCLCKVEFGLGQDGFEKRMLAKLSVQANDSAHDHYF
jgi:hypothetical protein